MSIQRLYSGPRMSQAVIHGGIVYLAGQVGAPGEDAEAQTRAVLASVDTFWPKPAPTDREFFRRRSGWPT